MRLFVLTPIYSSTTQGSGTTPVVHYFAKEWVKLGHDVHVYHLCARFPGFFYYVSRLFQHKLNTIFGSLVPTEIPTDAEYEIDGVHVHRIVIKKYIPHSLYSKHKISGIVDYLEKGFKQFGIPDVLIGHWHNPSLDIMMEVKNRIKIRTCLVLHENSFNLEKYYGDRTCDNLKLIDIIGFRNKTAKSNFIKRYGCPKSSFIAYSGVSPAFLEAGLNFRPDFEGGVIRFVFVGSLIARKHPTAIIKALDLVYPRNPFYITFVGDGAEKNNISSSQSNNSQGVISFTGRIIREEIIEHLKQSQIFVMISEGEIFGLVYLEAMALGLIPIGSRGEGIDGIIIDGYNGFLCNAGDSDELASIIGRINKMTKEDLESISRNAQNTAQNYSDINAAKHYIDSIV